MYGVNVPVREALRFLGVLLMSNACCLQAVAASRPALRYHREVHWLAVQPEYMIYS